MFIRYAAKDVEDLIEVKERMMNDVEKLMGNVEVARKVAGAMSRAYSEQGCKAGMMAILERISESAKQTLNLSACGAVPINYENDIL